MTDFLPYLLYVGILVVLNLFMKDDERLLHTSMMHTTYHLNKDHAKVFLG